MLNVTNHQRNANKKHNDIHLIPVRMAVIKKSTSAGEDVEKGEPFCTVGGNADWCSLWRAVMSYLKKLKMELPYEPVIPFLEIYLKKAKTLIQKNICTSICSIIYNSQDLEADQGCISR